MGKEPEDKVFISETTSNVNCTVNGLQESSVAVVVPESQVERAAGVAVIGRVGCDKAKDRVDCDEKPKKVTVVQVGSLSVDKKPNKLSANQLRNFQSRPNSESKLVVPLSVIVSDNKDEDQDLLILSTSIGATELSSKMISMMTTIGSNSPNSTSSKNSECDTFTLDSGTCSDLEVNSSSSLNSITPPPLPKKMSSKGKQEKLKSSDFDENEKFLQLKSSFHHLNDQEDNMSVISCGSNNSNCSSISLISCDSLNQHNNIIGKSLLRHGSLSPPQISAEIMQKSSPASGTLILNVNGEDQVDDNGIASLVISGKKTVLPTSLLADIRSRSQSLQSNNGHQLNGSRQNGPEAIAASEKFITKKLINFSMNSMDGEANSNRFSTANPYQDQGADTGHFYRNGHNKINSNHKLTKAAEQPRKSLSFENDNYYNFHINENQFNYLVNSGKSDKCIFDTNEETFAGYKDLSGTISSGSSTIRSNKGTIRGVKNRVRNGIATFLQMQHTNVKVSVVLRYMVIAITCDRQFLLRQSGLLRINE